jgi:hypothetical protein
MIIQEGATVRYQVTTNTSTSSISKSLLGVSVGLNEGVAVGSAEIVPAVGLNESGLYVGNAEEDPGDGA